MLAIDAGAPHDDRRRRPSPARRSSRAGGAAVSSGLQPGRPFDRPALDARDRRVRGEAARARLLRGARRDIAVSPADGCDRRRRRSTVEPGPHVRVVFAGDPLPDGNRDDARADPRGARPSIRICSRMPAATSRTRCASRAIAQRRRLYPRQRGRRAGADLHGHARPAASRRRRSTSRATSSLDAADIAPLLQIKPGEPFVEARVGARGRGDHRAVSRPRLPAGGGQAGRSRCCPSAGARQPSYRPVAIRFEITEGPQTIVSSVERRGPTAIAEPSSSQALLALTRASRSTGRNSTPIATPSSAPIATRASRASSVDLAAGVRRRSADGRRDVDRSARASRSSSITCCQRQRAHQRPTLIRREVTHSAGQAAGDDAISRASGGWRRSGCSAACASPSCRAPARRRATCSSRSRRRRPRPSTTAAASRWAALAAGRRAARPTSGSRSAPRGFFEISRRNLWGKNRSVDAVRARQLRPRDPAIDRADPDRQPAATASTTIAASFTFREPRAFDTPGDVQFTGLRRTGDAVELQLQPPRRDAPSTRAASAAFTVTGRYTFDYTQLFDEQIAPEDQLLIDRLFPQVQALDVLGSVLRDSRDDVLDPQRGAVVGIDGSVAARSLGSEVGFVKTFMQGVRLSSPAGPRRRARRRRAPRPRGRALRRRCRRSTRSPRRQPVQSSAPTIGASEPVFRRRSRSCRRASASSPAATPPCAASRSIGSAPTRRSIRRVSAGRQRPGDLQPRNARAVPGRACSSCGSSTPATSSRRARHRLDEMRMTSGFGFRYRSPIGPLRVDLGLQARARGCCSTGGRERSNVLHISLGQAF